MGYRRIRDTLEHDHDTHLNDKHVLRICRILGIKSTIKYRPNACTVHAKEAQHVADNVLKRNFIAEHPGEKWVTDVTEFKYYVKGEIHKLYLSVILDLYDRRVVAYYISDTNDNVLVFETFRQAREANPEAHPIFHSDRGFQYTSRQFHTMLEEAGMIQSMSRVGHCIDNGPMEGFWGILKRESYYGRRFTSREELVEMITDYIDYYNDRRVQRRLGVMTPMEKYEAYQAAT